MNSLCYWKKFWHRFCISSCNFFEWIRCIVAHMYCTCRLYRIWLNVRVKCEWMMSKKWYLWNLLSMTILLLIIILTALLFCIMNSRFSIRYSRIQSSSISSSSYFVKKKIERKKKKELVTYNIIYRDHDEIRTYVW